MDPAKLLVNPPIHTQPAAPAPDTTVFLHLVPILVLAHQFTLVLVSFEALRLSFGNGAWRKKKGNLGSCGDVSGSCKALKAWGHILIMYGIVSECEGSLWIYCP